MFFRNNVTCCVLSRVFYNNNLFEVTSIHLFKFYKIRVLLILMILKSYRVSWYKFCHRVSVSSSKTEFECSRIVIAVEFTI